MWYSLEQLLIIPLFNQKNLRVWKHRVQRSHFLITAAVKKRIKQYLPS